ncbi:MAG TPA: ATP-grasp domain-containing protein [Candidatus Binatia bacterium]|nr:ATP-grasp domain-containing protein [Candidatus Binatia bacterium]
MSLTPPDRSTDASARRTPTVLVTATLRWPLGARLAMALARAGCAVEAHVPRGHPAEALRCVQRVHRASELRSPLTLRHVIERSAPDFVIPCDDESALDLQRLYQDSRADPALRRVLEFSLGAPDASFLAVNRNRLMTLAAAGGVRVPATAMAHDTAELMQLVSAAGYPAVIKADETWGGEGVWIVDGEAAAQRAFNAAIARPTIGRALSQALLYRDATVWARRRRPARTGVTVQSFVHGHPANRAVACWRGEVIAGISVEVLHTQRRNGPATVVRTLDHPEMAEAARRLVRCLGVSGLWGFDFMLEAETGDAYLIEVNPRATPTAQLSLPDGLPPPAALHACITGTVPPPASDPAPGQVIAIFPDEWLRHPRSPYLRQLDVPWEEPELVRECLREPWAQRGLLARLRQKLKPAARAASMVAELPLPARFVRSEAPAPMESDGAGIAADLPERRGASALSASSATPLN